MFQKFWDNLVQFGISLIQFGVNLIQFGKKFGTFGTIGFNLVSIWIDHEI